MVRILYLAFGLSGGAGLIYEAVWSRYLALFLGHSAYAQVFVIAAYLGGMALGALWVGRKVRDLRRPLLWYVGVEVALALLGLLFHPLFQGTTALTFDHLIPALADPALVSGAKWVGALGLVLPPAILLGTTFPLVSSGLLRSFPLAPGRAVSLLYFTNSLGGAAGVLVGGFLLVGWVGLPGSLVAAAFLNVVAAVLAWLVSRRRGRMDHPGALEARIRGMEVIVAPRGLSGSGLRWLLLGVSFFTAVASFSYEIGWIRMLSLVMGSATHSFELMLSAFILGLALGAVFVRRWADGAVSPLGLLGWVQWLMGLAALATLPVYLSTFDFMAFLVDALPESFGGYLAFGAARYGLAVAIMLPSTILAGMTLPLITASLLHAGEGERSIGWVYGVNTVGAVLGVSLAGLVLLPLVGLKGMILAGAGLDMALGALVLACRSGRRSRPEWKPALQVAGAGVLALLAVQVGVEPDRRVLTSGVYRYGAVVQEEDQPVLFYEDGRTATVGVHHAAPLELLVLTTNGKPDASVSMRWIRAQDRVLPPRPIVYEDEVTQALLGLVPLAHVSGVASAASAASAASVALVGHGSGLTADLLLGDPSLRSVVTVEIEPEMIRASREFGAANRQVFGDPRSTFVIDDAKAYFASRNKRFDLIVSEPSNPWVSGTASLFTVEFYRRVEEYLTGDGVLAQWIHAYEMTDGLVTSVLAAIHRVFPSYRLFQVGPADLLILASPAVPLPGPEWDVFRHPAIARTLAHVPSFHPRYLDALLLADEKLLGPVLEEWNRVNSDFHPYLDQGAEQARFLGRVARGYLAFGDSRVDLMAFLEGEREPFAEKWVEPAYRMGPFQALAISAWLREARDGGGRPGDPGLPHFREARERYTTLVAELARESPPPDWPALTRLAARVEADLHGGTSGVVDTLFYASLFRFVRREGAPHEARAAADFLYGVAAWDHQRASGAAEILAGAWERGEEWLPLQIFLEGGVLARLSLGDEAGARELFHLLDPRQEGDPVDIRLTILETLAQRGWPEGIRGPRRNAGRSERPGSVRSPRTGGRSGESPLSGAGEPSPP
jgi:predicted membrane-bound spermidine synthase